MARRDRSKDGFPQDPVLALRARELLADVRQLVAAERWKDAAPRSAALVQMAPKLAEAHELMGIVAMRTGASKIAEACFERAATIGPASASRLLNWGKALAALHDPVAAERVLHRALLIRPDNPDTLMELAEAQLHQHRDADALKTLRRVLRRQPDHRLANHLASALTQAGAPDRDYVRNLFESYAGIFDQHLTQTLAYRVPEALADMIGATTIPAGPALDLGCGTGLVAEALAPSGRIIDGIDLAAAMVEQARSRSLYRHLAVGDCTELLNQDPTFSGPYSLICAADVFIYIGALEPLFQAMTPRLATGGVIAFSIETADHDEIEIRASGRFAHAPAYIENLMRQSGLHLLAQQPHTIRQEQERPIAGQLYLIQAAQS